MSFSGQIKEELFSVMGTSRHCQLAELAAYYQFCGHVEKDDFGHFFLKIQTENKNVARKCFTLFKKTFKIYSCVTTRMNRRGLGNTITYILKLEQQQNVKRLLDALKLTGQGKDGSVCVKEGNCTEPLLLKSSCCKRAFLRGAYLAAGSMSDPYKGYHLEIVCVDESQAEQLVKILKDFALDAKMVLRKKYYVVYMKEGENIADFLNIVEAHKALMEFENTRIFKDMRNRVNRKVNCEAANITKTVNASARQVEDIQYIRSVYGLEKLPEGLRQMAYVRLENPEAALGELGCLLDPPVGKSGVNHRLRKLSEFAKKLRG